MSDARVPGDVEGIFHINVNARDFDRSLAFYRLIGFEIVVDFAETEDRSFGEIGLGPVLRLPNDCSARAVLLLPKGKSDGPRIDLIEWQTPQVAAVARTSLAQPGVGRICLRTRDAFSLHDRLVEEGHQPYSRPVAISMGPSEILVFCVEDPDGVVIEFMQFVGSRTAQSPGLK